MPLVVVDVNAVLIAAHGVTSSADEVGEHSMVLLVVVGNVFGDAWFIVDGAAWWTSK